MVFRVHGSCFAVSVAQVGRVFCGRPEAFQCFSQGRFYVCLSLPVFVGAGSRPAFLPFRVPQPSFLRLGPHTASWLPARTMRRLSSRGSSPACLMRANDPGPPAGVAFAPVGVGRGICFYLVSRVIVPPALGGIRRARHCHSERSGRVYCSAGLRPRGHEVEESLCDFGCLTL
jgi:hypothetical protein